mgnify:CR=1 FL=1
MSVKVMGMVFDLPIAHYLKFVLLAYSNFADHDGTNVYPSVATIAKKTSYSERSVQTITRILEGMGLLIPDGKGINGTNKWRIPVSGDTIDYAGGADIAGVQVLRGAVSAARGATSAGGGCSLRREGVQPTAPDSSLTRHLTVINISSKSSSKKRATPEGLPEPTGDTLGDWLEVDRQAEEKNKPLISIIDALTSGFDYNFPRLGEEKKFDRIIHKIAKDLTLDGRNIKTFIEWAKNKKRDPYWYHNKPDQLWGDWPQAFSARSTSVHDILTKQVKEMRDGSPV